MHCVRPFLCLAFTAFLFVLPGAALACSCWHPTPEEYIKSSAAIFTGTVRSVTPIDKGIYSRAAIIEVETLHKGPPGRELTVLAQGGSGASCGYGFAEGPVTVFAQSKDGDLVTNLCMMIPYTSPQQRRGYDALLEVYMARRGELDAAVAAAPDDPSPVIAKARYLEEWRDFWRALDAWSNAEKMAPDNPEAPLGRGRTLFKMTRFAESIEPLERAHALAPENAEVRRYLGQARLHTGDMSQAAETDFKGANLKNLELAGAALAGRDFSESNLYTATFSGADLTGADFRKAKLYRPDFSGAQLGGAKLDELHISAGNLRNADLSSASLIKTNFRGAALEGADLSNVEGPNAYFGSATTRGAVFTGANLSGADFIGANAADTDFADADLSNVNFARSDLAGADLSRAKLGGAEFMAAHYDCRTRFPPDFDPHAAAMILTEAVCNGQPTKRDFSGVTLEFADFRGLDMSGVSFRGAQLKYVKFWDTVLANSDFSNAILGADFRGADLTGADFTDATVNDTFYGVGKSGVGSKPAKLVGTKFMGVKLSLRQFLVGHDDMTSADLSQADLTGAILDCAIVSPHHSPRNVERRAKELAQWERIVASQTGVPASICGE